MGCLGDGWVCALTLVILSGKHNIGMVLFFLKPLCWAHKSSSYPSFLSALVISSNTMALIVYFMSVILELVFYNLMSLFKISSFGPNSPTLAVL